jgi:Tol biopolymer transport system component
MLEDLYVGPSPDYRDDVLAAATVKRQRPAWTFPGRWLPMADIADRPAFAPHAPWRTIGVALVLIALLVAAAVIYVGTRPVKVPPPFGPARNGGIVFAAGGDIFIGDPVSGSSRPLVTGPEMDGNPLFSRDGTRVAFMRQVGAPATPAFDLIVANADGSGTKVLAKKLDTDDPYEWSPDGSYLVFTDTEFRLYRIDATGTTTPQLLDEHAYVQPGEFRPPDGGQILYEPQAVGATGSQGGHALWVMNSDGSGKRPMVEVPRERARDGDFGSVRYSPDGTMIAFLQAPAAGTDELRIFIMNADGTGLRPLTTETGLWTETDLAWSPDSKQIAFDRWHQNPASGSWEIQPIGVASIAGGKVRSIGPTPVSDGAWFDFSPDGTALVSIPGTILSESYPATRVQPTTIDIATGKTRTLDWQVGSTLTWQRLAL